MRPAKFRHAMREQVEVHVASLDDLVPHDHRVREVLAYVEALDLSALTDAIRSREGAAGAPAFHPATLLCLWLYATTEGVGSARRLSRLCEENIIYRWITGGDVINYHTLASFRTGCGAVLEDLLVASVAVLAEEGFVDLEGMTVAHDGMRVRAWAGRDSLRQRGSLESSLERARAYLREIGEREPAEDETPRRRAARERAARERAERLEQALEVIKDMEEAHRERTDREPRPPQVSKTDPQAAMLRMGNGGKDPAHNIQFTVETKNAIVTSVHTTYISSDTGTLCEAMELHAKRHHNLPRCVLADQGFFKYADIAELERRGCAVLVPDLYPNSKRRKVARGDKPFIEQWKNRIESEEAKALYRKRPSTVEWVNARVRSQGLLQLTVRGRAKAQIIGLWHALAHNIRRTFELRRQKLAPAPAA
ncbi:MAG: transposase [Candidatus Competibacteraceae bacterium]|nr:transposase [Candidatus Competibacteraceae bacterium]